MNFDTHFKDKNYVIQEGFKAGSAPVGMNKEVSRAAMYTQEQIVAFGGFRRRLCEV
jgi:hypothetical protein